jgi:MFS transporter, putative metabolite:H+ symporter
MLRALDEAPVTRRYLILTAAVMVGAVLDLFDFFLIAFVVPILNDEWNLTFGQAAVMLLSAGFGAIFGSILWGRLGDRLGRRRPLIAGLVLFSLGTGVMALAPDDGWWFIAIFRFVVGAGVAGVAVVAVPMVVEFTPTRLRTRITGFVTTAMVPIGILAAAVAAAVLDPHWRPLFALGLLPLTSALFALVYVPESPRWLLDQGRAEEARRVIAWLLDRPEEEIEPVGLPQRRDPGFGFGDLLRYRGSVFVTVVAWFGASAAVSGTFLWGPTFMEQVLNVDSDRASALFVLVILGSFAGRLFFSFFPQRVGRRVCGLVMGIGAPPLLALAAFSGQTELAGASLFVIALAGAAFFIDGGFANLAPYTSEVYPTSMRTQGMGLAWAASGVGRIFGPLGVALIAGTGDLVDPEATLSALKPAFLYLAAFSVLVGVGFLLVRYEPHGSDLETLSDELVAERQPAAHGAPATAAGVEPG